MNQQETGSPVAGGSSAGRLGRLARWLFLLARGVRPEIWAALIQVLGLALIAWLITQTVEKSVDQESLRQEHRLTLVREYEAQRARYFEQLIDLVNRATAEAEAMVEVSSSSYMVSSEVMPEEQTKLIEAERDEVRRRFNDFVLEWRGGWFKTGLFLQTYPSFQSDQATSQQVLDEWRGLQQAVEVYLVFAREAFVSRQVDVRVHQECLDEVRFRLEELSRMVLLNGRSPETEKE